jgi:signal transduction histidine kinase
MHDVTRPRILLADDREENRYVLSRVLSGAGFESVEAATGKAALELAETLPDLIILDVRLPDISGYEVCRSIKQNPRTGSIPILQISASFVSPEDRVRALDAGADGYLTHPIDRMVLVATVRALLRLRVAESNARKSANQWEATFNALTEGLAILDGDNCLVRWNHAFAKICGDYFQPATGKNPIEFFSRLDGGDLALGAESQSSAEVTLSDRAVQLSLSAIGNEPGVQDKVLIVSDVTDRKLAEYAMRTAEKLAATGKLANAIAHEINNPLEALTNLIYLARITEEVAPIHQFLETANTELERIARITRQTLAFHRDTQSPIPVDVTRLMRDVVELHESTSVTKRVKIVFDAQPSLPLRGYPGQLMQVFGNLVRNAIDAAPADSPVVVRVRPVHRNGEAGTRVVVHDRGPGIPAHVKEKIFDPFFTTKDLKGSGLGLWVSSRLIARHGGQIRFRTSERPGCSGATFEVFLPSDSTLDKDPKLD